MLALLRNQKVRGVLFQFLTVAGLVAFLWYIGANTVQNIEQRGIETGFDFLGSTSGFGIDETPLEYSEEHTHGDVFLVGLVNTLIIGAVGVILATILGVFVGVLRLSSNWLVKKIAAGYIDIFRNIPVLLQILFWYNLFVNFFPSPRESKELFAGIFLNNRGLYIPKPDWNATTISVLLSIAAAIVFIYFLNRWANKKQERTGKDVPVAIYGIGIFIFAPIIAYFVSGSDFNFDYPGLKGFNFSGGKVITPEFMSLTFALTIYTATFIAEAVRSGIEAVSKGQKEAASSLALSGYQTLKLVVLPQAVRIAIPPIINQYLNLIKNSSLAAAIGYPEIVTVFAGTSLNQVGQAIEIIAMTMLVYLTISLIVSAILNWFNHKMKIKER